MPTSSVLTGSLLRTAGRLFRAYWPALCFWFLLQHVTHRPLIDASVQLGLFNRPLGFFGLAVLIVVQLLCTIAMFQVLQPGMPALAHASQEDEPLGSALGLGSGVGPGTGWAKRTRLTDAIAVALLPFFAYYATWGLLRDVVAQYSMSLLSHIAGLGLPGPLDIIKANGLWISIAVTWLVRRISLSRHAKTRSPLWSIAATICEAYWVFLGVLAISSWKQWPWDWWHRRVVYVAWQTTWDDPRAWLVPIKQIVAPVLAFAQAAIGVMILPLVWLTIAAIIYGHDLRDQDALTAHARFERLHRRYTRLPLFVQRGAEKWSSGWRKKTVPILNSLRLLLRAGLRPALALCLCYVTLDFLCSWAFRGAVSLIGPLPRDVWNVVLGPLIMVVGDSSGQTRSLLQEPFRICLLAAAIEMTLRESRRPDSPTVETGDTAAAVSAG